MLNKLQNVPIIPGSRNSVIFLLLVCMLGSLFFSRALLSVSMIVFVTVSFFHRSVKEQFRQFLTTPLLWGMSVLFFLPLVSGFWSDDKKAWLEILQIKLPLFFLPLAFASPFRLSGKQWEWLACFFIAFITAGSIWSMFHYLADANTVNESYLAAKSLLTPLENDHVRFSWMVSVAILLAGKMIFSNGKTKPRTSALLAVILVWLVVFLHILAARTGLFSLYIIICAAGCWLIVKKLHWQYGLGLFILFLALPFIAYSVLPTFHNRVKYIMYDLGYFKEAHYLPGANDAVRVISLKAGYGLMKMYPVAGTGFGDVYAETKKWYGVNYPPMEERDKIYPSSEWMIYGAACGIPGLVAFALIMLVPFFVRTRDHFSWWLLNIIAAFSFLFDIGLEVQFGVFIYSFVVLGWWKWGYGKKM